MNRRFLLVLFVLVFSLLMASAAMASAKYMIVQDTNVIAEAAKPGSTGPVLDQRYVPEAPPGDEREAGLPGQPSARPGPSIPPSLLSVGEQESYLPGRERPTWQLLEQEPVRPLDPADDHETPLLEQPAWKLSSGGWGADTGAPSISPSFLTEGSDDFTLVVYLGSNYVFGLIDARAVATVFVDEVQVGASQADDRGFFWTTLYDSSGNKVILEGGEVVEVKKQDGTSIKSITIKPISGEVDQGDNSVSGRIDGSTSGIEVTVYAPGAENPELNYEKTTTTGAGGSFEVDFDDIYEFMAWDEPIIQYIENGVAVRRRVWAEPSLAVRPAPFSMVYGHAEPGTPITAKLYAGSTVKDSVQSIVPDSAFYVLTFEEQISVGDRVVVEFEGGESLELTVKELTMAVDPNLDTVTGKAVPGATVYGYVEDLNVHGLMSVEVHAAADQDGVYLLNFEDVDLLPGTNVWVFTKDAQGNIQDMCAWAPSVEVFQTYDEVNGAGSTTQLLPEDSRQITLTLYSAGVVSTFVTEMNPRGRYSFNAKDDNLPDIRPGDVVTVTSGAIDGWEGVVHVGSMSAAADLESDQFAGTVAPSTGRVELSGWYYPSVSRLGWTFDTLAVVDGTGSFTAEPPMFDLNENLAYQVSRRNEAEHLDRIDSETGGFGVVLPANLVCPSLGEPGIPFTVTLYEGDSDVIKAELYGVSKGPIGNAQELSFWDNGQQIQPGDKVRLQGGNGYDQSVVIPDLSISIDADLDVLQVRAPANHLVFVDVYDHGRGWVPSGPDGYFTVKPDQLQEVWSDGDLEWGDRADIMWLDENHTWVYAYSPNWPVIAAASDMEGRSSVYGFDAVPWSTIAITITGESGAVIVAGSTTAGSCDWCGPSDYWLGFPDGTIQPGRTVTVDFGPGFVDSVEVVEITAGADVGSDKVSGTAPGEAWLGSWAFNPRGEQISLEDIQADGEGSFTFDYGAAGWNVVDGEEFGIHYRAPHGHMVEYYFWLPAPELGIWKHTTGGFARPGGVYVYEISYDNRGTGPAKDTLITDTLPAGTSWAGDTSGFVPEIGPGGVITWNLGTLQPDDSGRFMVTLNVDLGISDDIESNCAGISTSSPGDWEPDDNSTCSEGVPVEGSGVDIRVDTWPNPGDPAAGQKFEYGIRVCNEHGAAVGSVWLTVTLPADTSLVSWRPENDWERFWVESSFDEDAGELVLFAPGFPGPMCNDLHVQLRVNPGTPLETILENRVEISTAGDENPDNNSRVNDEARVSGPRYDMNIGHWYNAGILTPEGWIIYGVSYWNAGNTPVQGQITATLPAGTSYQLGSGRLPNGESFEPVEIPGGLVWDLDAVEVNDGFGFDYTIEISDSVLPGTGLEDCVEVGIPFEDDTPHNNRACVRETVLEPGPNLRVWKQHNWNGDGQLRYDLRFENNGNETLTDIWLTDTLPLGTEWDGSWDMNFKWDRLVTQTLESDRLVWRFSELYPGDSGWINFNAKLEEPGKPVQWYTNTLEISAAENETVLDDNKYEDVAFSRGEVEHIEFSNIGSQNSMWGRAQPDTELTVITANGSMTTTVREDGNWDIPDVGLVEPGDIFTVTAGEGLLPVVIEIPDPFSVEVDSDADKISGQIGSLASGNVQVYGDWDGGFGEVQIGENGDYVVSYPNIPRGASGRIRYETIIDHAVVVLNREFYSLDLLLRVNYAHDWVEGNYEAGHTVWITVTESDGTEKGTAVLTTAPLPWGEGQTGFSTNVDGWTGKQPDIQPGDWVYGKVDNGQTTSVQIMEITGDPDSEADTIEGTMDVAGFGEPVRGRCEIWEDNGPQAIDFVVGPSDLNYFCDFGKVDWDLLPGQDISVRYIEPDQDEVINVFEEATPHLRIEKYSEGSPGEGGNLSFVVRLFNDGKAPAENVIITDTMQGISYLSDTSEMTAITGTLPGGDAYVRWELDSLGPESYAEFTVFVSVDAAAGENITNTVQISTANPYDQGDPSEKESAWHGVVEENNTNLNVGKYPWTGDPAPGQDFIWAVNVCNDGSTGSSTLVLTDTLPQHTSLNDWWPQHPGWEDLESGGGRLVLSRPSIPAHSCSEVYLDLHLDDEVEVGTDISNTAEIYASGDQKDGNWTESRVTVGHPYLNLGVGTGWSRGTLVPGGELYYNVSYWNNGNLPVTEKFLITATLPAHTNFRNAWDSQGELLPLEKGDGYVVFRFDGLRNGFSGGFEIVLDVENDAEPGTVLTNTVEITPYEGESSYDDNISAWTEQLYAHGPNLRVRKEAGWHGDRPGHAWYQVTVENVGDAGVEHAWVTDEYPAAMTLEGDPWPDPNLIEEFKRGDETSETEHWFRMQFSSLPAGFRHDFGFNAKLKDPDALGLVLTNTLSVDEPPGDTNAADNTATALLTTGPDLFVEKALVGGDLVPDGTAVFSLRFGNDIEPHTWWWGMQGNLHLTDTLPTDFEFITSTLTFCDQPEPCPIVPIIDGNKLHWSLYRLDANNWNEIQVVVKIPVNVGGSSEFSNSAEVASDDPEKDTEPDYDNNSDNLTFLVDLPEFQVSKVYESSQIAGTPVVYTLTVTNTGQAAGTGISLIDPLPAPVTYSEGGSSFVDGVVGWNIERIEPGDKAERSFSGTLSCAANGEVINQNYQVDGSDQGVISLPGSPESFNILAPTITVGFEASKETIEPGETMYFTSTSTTDGTALTYDWDFGDAESAFGAAASHTFTEPGEYSVELTVMDTCGFSDTDTQVIKVLSPAYEVSKVYEGSRVAGTVLTYTLSVTNTGQVKGKDIHLIDPIPDSFNYLSGGTPSGDNVEWDIDSIEAGSPVERSFSGALSCEAGKTVTNEGYRVNDSEFGITSPVGLPVSFEILPPDIRAVFNVSDESITIGDRLWFTSTSSTDGTPLNYTWDFGDGSTGSGAEVSHVFDEPGAFEVELTATDDCNFFETHKKIIQVQSPGFEVGKVYEGSRVAGTEITYKLTVTNTGQIAGTGISLIDPLPDLVTYSGGGSSFVDDVIGWDIDRIEPGGKAELSFSGTLSCTAGEPVTNQGYRVDGSDQGITSDEGAEVSFTIVEPKIDAGFDASQVSVGVGGIVYFTNTSTTDGTSLTYEWDFDDGDSDSSKNTSHVFLAPGSYKVKLTATDGCRYSDTHSITITVTGETVDQYKLFLPLIKR